MFESNKEKILLLQMPIPSRDFGMDTGNVSVAAGWLKRSALDISSASIEILPDETAAYGSDQYILEYISSLKPDVIGFTIYCWNLERSLYLHDQLKKRFSFYSVFGGPEITPDNQLLAETTVDTIVYGEGEGAFRGLLETSMMRGSRILNGNEIAYPVFNDSVYTSGILPISKQNSIFVETQRGCPFGCRFCYYNKARKKILFFESSYVLDSIRFAYEHNAREVYFLDPSFDIRPDLEYLLEKITEINKDKKLELYSEVRADRITEKQAILFAAAGFKGFETGLQSTNPVALERMNRTCDITRFAKGALILKKNGITPRVDLITGLPGDTLEDFKRSVDFVFDHDLYDDIQVFALSLLPGTDFRINAKSMNLEYQKKPPYYILSTPDFSENDIYSSFDYAMDAFDTELFPEPKLDLSIDNIPQADDMEIVSKLIFDYECSVQHLEHLSTRLSHPYQLIFRENISPDFINKAASVLTGLNPFTPLEIVIFASNSPPLSASILASVNLSRPHFLDNELYYESLDPGNRACTITIVSDVTMPIRPSVRVIVPWKTGLPPIKLLTQLSDFDGLYITHPPGPSETFAWIKKFGSKAFAFIPVTFKDVLFQRAWDDAAGLKIYREHTLLVCSKR